MPAFTVGGLYMVADSKLTLLQAEERKVHEERRRFVVLSGEETNGDDAWPVVLGCPVSASTRYKTRFDVQLGYSEAGVTKKCWIRVPAVQPVHKDDVQDLTGTLSAERLKEVQARLVEYLGLITRSAGGQGDAPSTHEPVA